MRDFVVKMVQNMFRTGFLVRASHTLLTWVITVVLFLHNTDLRRCEERGELLLPALFFLLVVLSVLLYFTVSLMDPGFVLTDTAKGVHGSSEETESMIPESSTPRLRRCGFCLLQLRYLQRHHLGAVVQRERVPAGGAGRGRGFLRGGGAAAGLPSLPGVRQLHHLGVHVAPPHLLPEDLQGRGEPLRPRSFLQPLGLLLHLQDGGLGAGLPEELPEPRLTSEHCFMLTSRADSD
ncbi:palmitoyltransferase ZDHHC12-A isoform X2 [Acanthochromis polyacanthus]|uniref:palmitoyltransferase ZDHHC12-A isoform X2 n=1 Tax=Acanthochromis polyacanthus TaxID=80966 RepID=UPI0022343DC7|nr:palmitoyltransferase ZDHHC12-A isoform X2 [Acanthochromis polyacanthus]